MSKKAPWRKAVVRKDAGHNSNVVIERNITKNKVANILMRRPGIRQADIAAMLNLTKGRISQIVKELAAEWHEERIASYEIDLGRKLSEIEMVKKECWDRLKRCKKATTGSRWVEMYLKAIGMEAKMLGLNAPDVHEIRTAENVGKDSRDAVAKAMAAQFNFINADNVQINNQKQIEEDNRDGVVVTEEIIEELDQSRIPEETFVEE